jgi:hypothetical protein
VRCFIHHRFARHFAHRFAPFFAHHSLFEASGEGSQLFKVDNEVPAGHDGEIFEGRWRRGGQGFVTIGEEGNVNVWEYEVG